MSEIEVDAIVRQMASEVASSLRRREFLEMTSAETMRQWQEATAAGLDPDSLAGMERVLLKAGVAAGDDPLDTLRIAQMRMQAGIMTYPERCAFIMHTTWQRRMDMEFVGFMYSTFLRITS